MKKFLVYTLATVAGIFLASIIFFIIFIGSLGAMMSSNKKEVNIKDNSVLVINTSTEIVDLPSDNIFSSFDLMSMNTVKSVGLNEVLKNIQKAANDPKIKGIYIDAGSTPSGFASLYEVRDALEKFKKESGKFVVAYSNEGMTQMSYFFASVADEVYLNPAAQMSLQGMASQTPYYKKALDKLGVDVQVFRHGKFKGAVEPYMLDKMSEENKEQISVYLNSIWKSILGKISSSRNISVDQLVYFSDNLSADYPEDALKNGLIDGILYADEFQDLLKEKLGVSSSKKINEVKMSKYSNVPASKDKSKKISRDKISIIYAEGEIVDENSYSDIYGTKYAELIRKERKDSTVKAIVFRVNSPGGSAMMSDLIWREIKLTTEVKPVVVSMGNYAASGGYYISAPATKIFAEPVTITGSIGVFGMMPQAKELIENKLLLNFETVSTNKHSDMGSIVRPVTEEEKEYMQKGIEKVYSEFVNKVADGRRMTFEGVDEIAQGRVWSGSDAIKIGLVDELGGLTDAINEAARLANIENYRTKELPEEDSYSSFFKQLTEEAKVRMLKKELGEYYNVFKSVQNIKNIDGVQARMPYTIEMGY
ncbi:MAG: signal peptide peptidase SppA [Bacteroidales bacterium]|nr:signal peptide peptidase SppA [Bacteroidales bacterium]